MNHSICLFIDHLKVHELPNTVTCQKCGVVLKDAKALKRHDSRDHMDNTKTGTKHSVESKPPNE